MTKLTEWLTVLGALFCVWLAVLNSENNFTRQHPDLLLWSPVICVAVFGLHAAGVVLYRTVTFNNCEEAAVELQEQIKTAKEDLKRLGFRFKEAQT